MCRNREIQELTTWMIATFLNRTHKQWYGIFLSPRLSIKVSSYSTLIVMMFLKGLFASGILKGKKMEGLFFISK